MVPVPARALVLRGGAFCQKLRHFYQLLFVANYCAIIYGWAAAAVMQ
jgi:hypothetical protein